MAPRNEVTRILSAIEQGDSHAAEQLLPLVYEELRKLAAQKLTPERPAAELPKTKVPAGKGSGQLVEVTGAQCL
jgi:hypothetical protein